MKIFKAGDIILIAFFLVLGAGGAVLIWNRAGSGDVCVIKSVEGVQTIALPADTVVTLNGPVGRTVVEVRGKQVRVRDSDCRNKICVRTGWIQSSGQLSVCAPNRVMVQVKSGDGVDGITR
ncbi:NusG domain II-containing protein [candidate division WOR-3 bacterium]|nr:NusG domain II-containing protein [candidate division WOR-3 bacterium]